MQLGREPYQTELDDEVEKEIAAVVSKNEERKKRKGVDGGVNVRIGVNKDVEDRLLLLEDSIDKWDEKMDVMGSMLSKLYKAQFGEEAVIVHDDEGLQSPISEKDESGDSQGRSNSSGEKGSVQLSHKDDRSDGRTSEEEVDISPGKAAEVQLDSRKLKGKDVQEGVEEAEVASVAEGGGKAGSVAGPSEQVRCGLSNSSQIKTVSSSYQ